jgi:SAM-dependent methyltransferase
VVRTGTEEYYRARALEYDQVYDKPERQDDLARLRAWLVPALTGRRVLEVAAGTGYWTAVYADLADSVLVTDASTETLAVARGRRAWPGTVRFAQADAFALAPVVSGTVVSGTALSTAAVSGAAGGPAEDRGFDAGFAGFFWSHVPVGLLDGFLAGFAGRLHPPATLVFADNRYVAGSNHPVSRRDPDGNTYQQRQLADGSSWEVLKNFPSPAGIRARLAALAGADPDLITVTEYRYYWTAVCTLGPG